MRRRMQALVAARERHLEAAGRVLDYGGQAAISEMVVAMLAEARARRNVAQNVAQTMPMQAHL